MLLRPNLGWRGAEHTNRSWHVVDTWGSGSREQRRPASRVCCMPVPAFMEGVGWASSITKFASFEGRRTEFS